MAEGYVKISDEDKLKAAETYKSEGNELFRSKNLKKAMGKYHRAILQLKGVGKGSNYEALFGISNQEKQSLSPEYQAKFDKLKVDCFNNLAACLLQTEQPTYDKVVEYCDEVLAVSPSNVKAHHRKGVALYHLGNYDDSLQALKKADEKDPATKKYILMCKQAIEKADKALRKTYRSMFVSGSSKATEDTACVTTTTNSSVNGHVEVSPGVQPTSDANISSDATKS